MDTNFTADSLPKAVQWLFETNGYAVEGPLQVNGAQVDLIATQLSGLNASRVYIEVTVEYVGVDKFGKDLTKLNMFKEPGSLRLIVSSTGFTEPVRERAKANDVLTYTYEELFKQFEKTEPYVTHVLSDETVTGRRLAILENIYEEPHFDDEHGRHLATEYLNEWLAEEDPKSRWLILVGEYGTGKTALTRVLQRRWTEAYKQRANGRLPFRLELKDFAKQFDARGLLHHFLDRNELSHLPIAFVESMIANGRVVLLLDGYDEMAQYLNVRERRACLEALADLARDGARGILTSRPNYFTEAEELRVFEVLYRRLADDRLLLEVDRPVIEQERNVDRLLEQFILRRFERRLRDLTADQTKTLIKRQLADDEEGAKAVVGLLERIFRPEGGAQVSLAGKPVIVGYLIQVVEQLKSDDSLRGPERLSEWQVYDLIVSKLMQRDYGRTPELLPSERRQFLERLSVEVAKRQARDIPLLQFERIVEDTFRSQIARRGIETGTDARDSFIDDLRSSSTLTRVEDARGDHLTYSHNSLREFLLVSYLVNRALADAPEELRVPLTDLMFLFAASMPKEERARVVAKLGQHWPSRTAVVGWQQVLNLIWPAVLDSQPEVAVADALREIVGSGLDLSGVALHGISFSPAGRKSDLAGLNGINAEFTQVDFSGVNLEQAKFAGVALDACVFRNANLAGADFSNALLIDCDLTDTRVQDTNFQGLYPDSNALLGSRIGAVGEVTILEGEALRGYLKAQGASVDPVDDYWVYAQHPKFTVIEKICRVLSDGAWHQRRGVEQRGEAGADIALARAFVDSLIKQGLVAAKGRGGAAAPIGATPQGRGVLLQLADRHQLPHELVEFLRRFLG